MDITIQDRLTALPLISQKKLLDILDKIPNLKDFVIEPSLIKPLEHVVGVSKLKSHGVDKIYKLDKINSQFTNVQVVFLVESNLISLKHVCDKINSEILRTKDKSYCVIVVGKVTGSIRHLIEEEGLHGIITTYNYCWELIPLDNDSKLLSLETHRLFKSLFVEGEQSWLSVVAKSVWSLQLLLGMPVTTLCVGNYSQIVDNMVSVYCEEISKPEKYCDFSCLILIDRSADYVSTLLRGCTYTSVIDEVFGVNSGFLEVPSEEGKKALSYSLSSGDEVYTQIKNSHFSNVFTYLSAKAKEISNDRKKREMMQLQEIKAYIKETLGNVTMLKDSLAYHIKVCEMTVNSIGESFQSLCETEQDMLQSRNRKECISFIEDCIAMNKVDQSGILRLIALLSYTGEGLYSNEAMSLKAQFLHSFGYQSLPCFHNLKKLGLFMEQGNVLSTNELKSIHKVAQAVTAPIRRSTFFNQAQKLKQFPLTGDDYDLRNPRDPGYVFNGAYTPLISQLIYLIARNEMSFTEIGNILSNTRFKDKRPTNSSSLRTFIVYFIGGVTYAEAASLQLLEKLLDVKIIIAATSITNGNRIVQSCL